MTAASFVSTKPRNMTKDIWLNLPVKDVAKSKAFFQAIGFSFNEAQSQGPNSACLLIGSKNVVVMLFAEAMILLREERSSIRERVDGMKYETVARDEVAKGAYNLALQDVLLLIKD